jgi:hypothetical protein
VVARRRQIARDEGRRRRSTLLSCLGLAAVAVLAYWLLTGPLLAIHGVTVRGYHRADRDDLVAALTRTAEDGTVLSLPVARLEAVAHQYPWVGGISVAREWPRGVAIDIFPATPAAVAATRQGAVLVTAEGRVLGPVPKEAGLGWLRLSEKGPPPSPGEMLPDADRATLAFLAAADPDVARRVRELRVTRGGQMTGRLTGGPELHLGSTDRPAAKAIALGLLLAHLSPEDEQTAPYIDLSFPERPALGPPSTTLDETSSVSG